MESNYRWKGKKKKNYFFSKSSPSTESFEMYLFLGGPENPLDLFLLSFFLSFFFFSQDMRVRFLGGFSLSKSYSKLKFWLSRVRSLTKSTFKLLFKQILSMIYSLSPSKGSQISKMKVSPKNREKEREKKTNPWYDIIILIFWTTVPVKTVVSEKTLLTARIWCFGKKNKLNHR